MQLSSVSNVEQTGNRNATVSRQFDDDQTSNIFQTSSDNFASVQQGDPLLAPTDDSWGNDSFVDQDGDGEHRAIVRQLDLTSISVVDQDGLGNFCLLYTSDAADE